MSKFSFLLPIIITEAFLGCLTFGAKLDFTTPAPSRINPTVINPEKPTLVLHTYANYGGHTLPMGPISTVSAQIALDAIQRTQLLPDYNLVIEYHDDKMCENGDVVSRLANHLNSNTNLTENIVPIFSGPACSDNAFTGVMLQYYNFVGLADGTIILEISTNRRKYNSFFMLRTSFESFYVAIPEFMKSNGWSRVFLLTETYTFWTPFEDLLQYHLMKLDILLAGTAKVLTLSGTLPDPEHFQQAVQDLAAYDPRIVVVNTHFGAIIACWLYYYGLYGPNYVFLFFGPAFFLPNSELRAAGCTDEMLAAVLPSVIYYSYGVPNNLDPNAIDILGTKAQYLDDILKERIDHPELNDKWFYWRSHTYSEVVASALTLNYTERKLQQNNDTLINWVTHSENFKTNASYVHSIMAEGLSNFHYKGLNTYAKLNISGRIGITGFWQMQQGKVDLNDPLGLVASFKTVPIAVYDFTDTKNTDPVTAVFGKPVWRTQDSLPPFDALHVVQLEEPIISEVASKVLIAIASLLLFVNFALCLLTIVRLKKDKVVQSLPLINLLVLVGNIFLDCYVFVLPVFPDNTVVSRCIAASLILAAGFSLVAGGILGKLQIAYTTDTICRSTSQNHRGNSVARRNTTTVSQTARRVTFRQSDEVIAAQRAWLLKQRMEKYSTLSKRVVFATIAYALFNLALITTWHSRQTPSMQRIQRELDLPKSDGYNIAYQHYTKACKLDMNSSLSQGILGAMGVTYIIVALMTLTYAFHLRKRASFATTGIGDVTLFAITSYSIFVISLAGAAVIAMFFSDDATALEIATSALAIIIASVATAIIFVPKLVAKDFA